MPDMIGWTAPPGFLDYGPNGAGQAAGRPRVADPSKEYVSAGRWFRPGELPRALDATLDDVMRRFGPRIYDAMDFDPAVRSAKDTLKFAIVAGGMDLAPAVEPKAGVKSRSADEALAAELVDFCWRSVERVGDFEDQAFDLLESVRVGAKLAKVTVEPAEAGPDAGKVVLKSFKVKPNDLWRFVVDEWMTVVGIEARDPGGGDRVVYRPDPFVWMSWEPRDGDPRGTSVYHAANTAWDHKMVTWPELRTYLFQFASGKVVGTTAQNDVAPRPAIDAAGAVIAGAPPITPQEYMARGLANTQNGSVYVGPFGSTVQVIFPTGDGAAFHKAVELFNQEITYAILGTTRANREAQHGSKADNEGGQDILALKAERGRKALSAAIRRALRLLVAANHGDDVAARLTPLVTFGQAEHRDRPALWGAAAGLMTSGYLGESQVAELDAMIGLPIRDAEADAKAAEEREAKAMEAQQAIAGAVPGEEEAEEEEEEEAPAQFAASPSEPWGTEDLIAARGLIDAAAALERWSKGTETLANRLAVLGYLADDAKATLRAEGEALAAKLAAMAHPATFAAADALAIDEPEAEAEAEAEVVEEDSGLGLEAWFLITAWFEAMSLRLRRAHLAGSMVMVGPIDLTSAEGEALKRANADQVRYLAGFAMALASGKQPPTRIGQRAGSYGDSVWTVAMAVQQADAIRRGMTEARSVLGATDRSCTGKPDAEGRPSCVAEAGKKWQPIGVVSLPGRRKCGGACKCHLEYRAGKGVTP